MATFTGNFAELMETRQKEIFYKEFMMQELMFPSLFARKTSVKSHEDRLRVAGLGSFREKLEGNPISFDDPVQGTRVRTVHQTFGLGYRATWEAIADDQWDVLDKIPADLGDSARDHQERLAWGLMNDAYSAGGTFTGLENENLFSATHTLLKTGGTQSNILSPPIALSITGLEDAITAARSMLSDEGRFINTTYNKLLYHPDLAHVAYVLLETVLRPGSADNDVWPEAEAMQSMLYSSFVQPVYEEFLDAAVVAGLFADVPGFTELDFKTRRRELSQAQWSGPVPRSQGNQCSWPALLTRFQKAPGGDR